MSEQRRILRNALLATIPIFIGCLLEALFGGDSIWNIPPIWNYNPVLSDYVWRFMEMYGGGFFVYFLLKVYPVVKEIENRN